MLVGHGGFGMSRCVEIFPDDNSPSGVHASGTGGGVG